MSYHNALTKLERGTSAEAGKSRKQYRKESADQTRACDKKGELDMDVMMAHIDVSIISS